MVYISRPQVQLGPDNKPLLATIVSLIQIPKKGGHDGAALEVWGVTQYCFARNTNHLTGILIRLHICNNFVSWVWYSGTPAVLDCSGCRFNVVRSHVKSPVF